MNEAKNGSEMTTAATPVAHRWYSVFRNIGMWAIAVSLGAAAIIGVYGLNIPPSVQRILYISALAAVPLAVLAGLVFPYRSRGALSGGRTAFGWLAGGLVGLALGIVLAGCPDGLRLDDEQLFAMASRSLEQVTDYSALESEAYRVLQRQRDRLAGVPPEGEDGEFSDEFPELDAFLRRIVDCGVNLSMYPGERFGPLLVVRIGNHRNYVWLGFHIRWSRPPFLPSSVREATPYLIFSSENLL